VLPPLPLLPFQGWVLLPKGTNLCFHERAEVRVCANPRLQPPHARAARGAVLRHQREGNPLVIPYESKDHCCLSDPSLYGGRCQPPVQPRHRLPRPCESVARRLIPRVEFPPAVHQPQGVLDGLKTSHVADAASLRSSSGLGGTFRLGGCGRQALVAERVRNTVKVAPNQVEVRGVQPRQKSVCEEGPPLPGRVRSVDRRDSEGFAIKGAGG